MNNSNGISKLVSIFTKPGFAIMVAVIATYFVSIIIDVMDPLRSIAVAFLICLTSFLLGWFAMIIFQEINKPNLLEKEELESLCKRLSSQIIQLDIMNDILYEEALKKKWY